MALYTGHLLPYTLPLILLSAMLNCYSFSPLEHRQCDSLGVVTIIHSLI